MTMLKKGVSMSSRPLNARKLRELKRGKGTARGSNLIFTPNIEESAAELIAEAAEEMRENRPDEIVLCLQCSGVIPCGCGWEVRP